MQLLLPLLVSFLFYSSCVSAQESFPSSSSETPTTKCSQRPRIDDLLSHPNIYSLISKTNVNPQDYLGICELKGPLPHLERHESIYGLAPLVNKVNELLAMGISAQHIAVILDLHGTISLEKEPEPKPLTLKPGVLSSLIILKNSGINLSLSSAWDDFSRILWDVHTLNLNQIFDVPMGDVDLFGELHQPLTPKIITHNDIDVIGYQCGLVASTKFRIHERFYRRKGFSPALIDADKLNTVTHVLFADDSPVNLTYVMDDFFMKRAARSIEALYLFDIIDE